MINLTNNSNDYKVGERTQFHICYTVKNKKYALFLVNTIINAQFESHNNFTIFCCDDESKEVCKKYGLKFRESYGIDVYNDKVLNAMKLSNELKDTLIMSIDVMCLYDFHNIRGAFGRITNYKNNTIYYKNYFLEFGDSSKKMKNCVAGGLLFYYNISQKLIDTYLKCYNKVLSKKKNIPYEDNRIFNECVVTEESVLTFNKHRLHLKLLTKEMCIKADRSIIDVGGGETVNHMVKNNLRYNRFCYLNEDVYEDLKKCV